MDKQIDKSQLRKEQRRRILKSGLIGGGVIAAAVMVILWLGKSVDGKNLRFSTVEEGPLETSVAATGKVVPEFEEIINSPLTTRIVKVYAQPGDTVTEGMPLIQLDLETAETDYEKLLDQQQIRQQELTQLQLNNRTQLSELAMQVEVKEMELNRLAVEVDNERRLDSLGSGTGDRVRQAETSFATCRLELRQLRERLANEKLRMAAAEKTQELNLSSFRKDVALQRRTLDQGRIPAPHHGVLTFISNEIGSQIAAGEKVAVVSDLSSFKIEGEVAEGNSNKVAIGSEVSVRIGGTELAGVVTNLTPQAKGGMVSFIVRLDENHNSRLRSGLRAELTVNYGYKDKVLRILNGPYFKGPGEYGLYVKTGDNTVKKRKVRLGDSNREYVEVLEGLASGDEVVVTDMEEYMQYDKLKIK